MTDETDNASTGTPTDLGWRRTGYICSECDREVLEHLRHGDWCRCIDREHHDDVVKAARALLDDRTETT